MQYLIGIDIGTSGTKTVLFDTLGNALKSHTVEYPLYQPQNGWAEQNPQDWWNAVQQTLLYVTSGINSTDIKAVGLSGQMHGVVMLDENNEVIRPAILWCDSRAVKECAEITEKAGKKRLIEITANPALVGFSAAKILWIKNNEPHSYKKCRHILLPKDYIRFKLTGEFASEVSDASGTQLLDIKNRQWSDEILKILDIDKSLLGKLYESPEITGTVTPKAAELTGLAPGTIVVGGAGDNAAAAVGTGVVTDGKAFTPIGTSGVVYAHTSSPVIDAAGRVHTFCCAVPGKWHVMGVTQAAGLSLKWLRDNFCSEEINLAKEQDKDPYYIMDNEAKNVPIGCNKLIYLPYLMGERTPHLDPNARGVFFGLSAIHSKSDMIRSVMEGVAFSLRDCAEIIKNMNINISDMTICGGGAKSPLWRQIISDIYETGIKTITSAEGPALGAAILAGTGAGIYKSVEDGCEKIIQYKEITNPIPENSLTYNKFYPLYKKLYISLKECFSEFNSLK